MVEPTGSPFRTVRYHPDKVGLNADAAAANDYFVFLKQSRDVILDPTKRFAYDRFGPLIFQQCQLCATTEEYIKHALLNVAYTYLPLLAGLVVC